MLKHVCRCKKDIYQLVSQNYALGSGVQIEDLTRRYCSIPRDDLPGGDYTGRS